MDKTILQKVGLTKAESIIYLSVLKLGEATVKNISKDTGFHRTNIYDVLEQLREKGLISVIKLGKVLQYKCTDVDNLYSFIKDKEKSLKELMPDLQKIQKLHKEETEVIVYKGTSGMKAAFNDILKEKKTYYGLGVSGQLRKYLPIYAKQFIRKQMEKKIKYYSLYTKGIELPKSCTEARIIPKEMSSPVATLIYSDKVFVSIWEPTMIAIVMKSKEVAETYKKHFDLLWKIAKK